MMKADHLLEQSAALSLCAIIEERLQTKHVIAPFQPLIALHAGHLLCRSRLLDPLRAGLAGLDKSLEAKQEVAPHGIAACHERGDVANAPLIEPQLRPLGCRLDDPLESGALPVRMIARAAHPDGAVRAHLANRHAEHHRTLRSEE